MQQDARLLQAAVDAGWSQEEAQTAIDRIRSNAATKVLQDSSSTLPSTPATPDMFPSR